MAEWSKALVWKAEGPGIDSRRRRSCFFRKMVIARKVAEKREKWKKEKRGKRKGERTVKGKKNFF